MAADSTSQDKYVQWNVFASIQKGFEEEQDMKEVCIFIGHLNDSCRDAAVYNRSNCVSK